MAEKTYKVVRYDPVHHKVLTGNGVSWNGGRDMRFCVVDIETGQILDDAQGYGYKSPQNAHAAYGYKNRDRSKDKEKYAKKRHIKNWLKEHPDFAGAMKRNAFEIAKGSWGPNDKFDAKLVGEMLKDAELETDFTPGELLQVWKEPDIPDS